MRTCADCGKPLQSDNQSGRCSHCRRQCYLCDQPIRLGDGGACRDCRQTLAQIAEAQAMGPPPAFAPPGHEERIAKYQELAARGEPLGTT